MVFQKTLIEQRKINKLTQRQVAEYLGITQPSVYIRSEKRTIRADFDQPCKISGLFDVSADYLPGRTDL